MEKATSGSFLSSAGTAPNNFTWGSRPLLGIKDSSIMYAVKTGAMTQYTRLEGCVQISPGCPCPVLDKSLITPPYIPAIPGQVSGIVFTVGSIIVSWNAPTTGDGPFTYIVTPYLNNVAQSPVTTTATTYRFTGLDEMQPYTFTICAMNAAGSGPVVPTSSFMSPPADLATILSGGGLPVMDVTSSLNYIINNGLDLLMSYAASLNMGPTFASRMMYIWSASVAQAWNWVCADSRVTGVHDNWDWTANKNGVPLSDCDCIIWVSNAIDLITPSFIASYTSIYTYSAADVARVQAAGNWSGWSAAWTAWFTTHRGVSTKTNCTSLTDGSSIAANIMPTNNAAGSIPASGPNIQGAANWVDPVNYTIVVDGKTVTNFGSYPQPQQWSRLTVNGTEQKYLSWLWDSVTSTCLSASDEQAITRQPEIVPPSGDERDAEIDNMMSIVANLTDSQKMEAEFWAGSAVNSVSPPHMCIWLWKEYIRNIGATCPVIVFSLLDLAIHIFETGRLVWGIKAMYMQDRPIQEIRRRYTGQPVASWNGTVSGDQWIPYQRSNFVTPPFPDFVSGHSGFTKGFALVMNKWFGNTITKNVMTYDQLPLMAPLFSKTQAAPYGDFVISSGASTIQSGLTPATPVTLSFTAWDDMATSAGMSRLYGGIHTISAHTASQTVAALLDNDINASWNISITPLGGGFADVFVPQVANDTLVPDMEAVSISDIVNTAIAPTPVVTSPSTDPSADPSAPVV